MKKYGQLFSLLLGLAFFAISCGGNDAEQQREAAADTENTESVSSDPTVAAAQEAMREAADQMSDMSGDADREIIPFRELKEAMPANLLGMERTKLDGQQSGYAGFKVSTANAEYRSGDKSLEIAVVDAIGVGFAQAGAAWAMTDIERESEEEVARTLMVDGNKAYYEYNFNSKDGQLSVISNGLIVTIEGNNIDQDDYEKVFRELNINRLTK